jgi:hypothetical protein
MTILQIFMVYNLSRERQNWSEGDGYYVGQRVTDFFDKVCKGTKFSSSDFFVNPSVSDVKQGDLVCYILENKKISIITPKYTGALPHGHAGATWWSPSDEAMISEVYVEELGTFDDRYAMAANTIIHELMHNKLDAHPRLRIFRDMHKDIQKGSVSKAKVNSSAIPNEADISAMRRGIALDIPQYTGDFSKAFYQ